MTLSVGFPQETVKSVLGSTPPSWLTGPGGHERGRQRPSWSNRKGNLPDPTYKTHAEGQTIGWPGLVHSKGKKECTRPCGHQESKAGTRNAALCSQEACGLSAPARPQREVLPCSSGPSCLPQRASVRGQPDSAVRAQHSWGPRLNCEVCTGRV